MAKSLTPNDLTQVAIQPSASPVSLNILPAPGQRFSGNTLQQIGESLAAFSPSLQGMLARRVEEDKRALSAQGAAVDFSSAFDVDPAASPADRQAALNDAFKQSIAKQGGPDSANPFFLIAARQNFGRTVGLRYRNALASLRDEATDPDNPVPFGEIARKAAEMAGAEAVTNDVYGASGFASVAQEVNAEMSGAFQQEMRKKQDFLAIERTQAGIADGLVSASQGEGEFTPDSLIGQTIQRSIDSIQLTSSDPETARKTVVGAAQIALGQIKDESDAEELMGALTSMRFGKATIRENPALFVQLLRLKDQRLDEIAAEGNRKERILKQQVQSGIRDIYALGFNEKVSRAVLNGTPDQAQQVLESTLDEYLTKNPDLDPTVRDAIRRDLQLDLDPLYSAVMRQRNASNDAAFERGFGLIDDGTIVDSQVLRMWASDNQLTMTQQQQLSRYFAENVGVVRSAAGYYAQTKGKEIIGRVLQGMSASGRLPLGMNGQPTITPSAQDEAQTLEMEWRSGAYEQVQQFVRGAATDPTGKTYQQIKDESGVETANRAINGVLDAWYDKQIEDWNARSQATKAASDAGLKVSSADPAVSFVEEVASGQKSTLDALSTQIEASTMTVDDRKKVVMEAMEGDIDRIKKIGYEVGFGFGGAYNPEVLVDRLSEMWRVARADGTVGVKQLGYLWDSRVNYTPDTIIQHYGQVKRSAAVGLTPEEIMANETSEGFPVFGVVLPHKKDAVPYAFSIPMFRSESELTDPTTVNAVMDSMNIPTELRQQFVARQVTLLRVKQTLSSEFDPKVRQSPF